MSQHKGKIRFRFKRKRTQGKRKRLVLPTVMAMILAMFAMVFATAGVASATRGGSGGDNGTVKTHNVGTSTDDVSDEPKVDCTGFYLDAFYYDGKQSIDWWILNKDDAKVLDGNIPLNADGHGYTDTLSLPNGQYKLYWTWDGKNGEAKHKEFKVEGDCEQSPPTEIAVPDVPVVDPCGPNNAHYGDVPAGHYTVTRNEDGSITLTADKGYTFPDGQETVTLPAPEDSNEPCPPTDQQVTPVTPGFADGCPNELFVPTVEGVQYQLNGENVDGGVIQHLAGSYTVSAVAKEGYVLQDYSGPWTHDFPKETCPTELKTVTPVAPTATTPSCKTTTTITVTPPSQEGVIWDPAEPQQLRLRETKTITASPKEGYAFTEGARRSWTFTNNFDQPCFGDAPPNNPTVPVDHPRPKPKPTAMPETGWTGSPQSGSPAAMWFLAAGLCAMLSLGSASLGVAVNRRRQDGA